MDAKKIVFSLENTEAFRKQEARFRSRLLAFKGLNKHNFHHIDRGGDFEIFNKRLSPLGELYRSEWFNKFNFRKVIFSIN